MNLIVCPSRLFAVYLLAYIHGETAISEYEIVIEGLEKIPIELTQIAETLNAKFILESQMYEKSYEEVLIHSYFKFNFQQEYISKLKFKSLSLFADGMRNGLYVLLPIHTKVKKIIYFGFKVVDQSFSRVLKHSGLDTKVKIVSWEAIGYIWRELFKLKGNSVSKNMSSDDFLLTMRYWGIDSSQYSFKPQVSVIEYIRDELSHLKKFQRLIFRPHPWIQNDIKKQELGVIFGPGVQIEFWDDFFNPYPDFPELTEPEAILWNVQGSPKYFFGFDSSLNILVNQEHPSTRIIWPNETLYANFFERPRSIEIVREQVNLMKSISSHNLRMTQINDGFSIDGTAMEAALTQKVIEGWTRERDALTRERDALTRERDAIVNSKIWRLSLPIRQMMKLIRRWSDG